MQHRPFIAVGIIIALTLYPSVAQCRGSSGGSRGSSHSSSVFAHDRAERGAETRRADSTFVLPHTTLRKASAAPPKDTFSGYTVAKPAAPITSGHAHRDYRWLDKYTSTQNSSVRRDSRGRIERSQTAREQFMHDTGFPHGRRGYVIDHVVPLACGGADAPSNMQWQTVAEAKAKDKWERNGCKA